MLQEATPTLLTLVLALMFSPAILAQQPGTAPPASQPPSPPPAVPAQSSAPTPTGAQAAPAPEPPASSAARQPTKVSGGSSVALAAEPSAAEGKDGKVVLTSGTHIPLVLHNGISTRTAKAGDPVYLETLFPVLADGRVVIPAGSYVSGEITESKRPGRVTGRGELGIQFNTMIL